ncbi:MAG: hypothetical protein HND59_03560 [Pseudomonadota bacterium]|nr:MAG: hypothetical protein HND59_03560 [Pseudomonadota bacterium]
MRKTLLTSAAVLLMSASSAWAADDLLAMARQHFKPIPSIIPSVKDNAVTREKAELGM